MKTILKLSIFLSALLFSLLANAQTSKESTLFLSLKKNDSLIFDSAFNQCKTKDLKDLVSEDIEFYHDTSGIDHGKETFLKSIEQNICGNPKVRPLRKLVQGSLEVFPLKNNGTLYGAIQKGEHDFFLKEDDEIRPTVRAKFTHLWLLENNKWVLKRVLSYDHQPIQN
jgi:hypothetical protein